MINSYESWDDSEFPLAYLITIRTYGTWLHGDDRFSVDSRPGKNKYGQPKTPPSKNLESGMKALAKQEPFILDKTQRIAVDLSIRETSQIRGYVVHALNVRTNHLHAVVLARSKPEPIIRGFKSHATRKLRDCYLVGKDERVWSRGGSRRYLWKQRYVDKAIDYVLYGQGKLDFE